MFVVKKWLGKQLGIVSALGIDSPHGYLYSLVMPTTQNVKVIFRINAADALNSIGADTLADFRVVRSFGTVATVTGTAVAVQSALATLKRKGAIGGIAYATAFAASTNL